MPKDTQAFGTVFYIPVCERAHYEDCMNDIQIFKNTMSSLEIAELTGKQHSNVMRDIRNILEQLEEKHKFNFELMFKITKLGNNAERKDPYYLLTKKDCLLLASGYDANLRAKIINRWEELEAEKQDKVEKKLPKTYLEALKELVVVVEANEMLSLENKSMKPKAEYFDNLVDRNLLTNIRDTAKQIGIKEKDFVNYLLENKYMYRDKKKQLRPYAEHVPSLFQIKDYENNGHTGQQVLLTPKGKETFRLLVG